MPNTLSPLAKLQPIAGLPNFRDLGGLVSTDGARVKHGRVFRSQGFDAVGDAGLQALATLNIRLVCDLRSVMERERAPSRWPSGQAPKVLSFDVRTDTRAHNEKTVSKVDYGDDGVGARKAILANYQQMPNAFADVLPQLFRHLTDEAHLPAVIHCHAGKDRTGFIVAMILFALDVPREQIFADYLLTRQLLDPAVLAEDLVDMFARFRASVLSVQALLPIADVEVDYLETALASVESQFGSIERYLEDVAGLDPVRRARLRELLLEK